jgi:trehalose 6-phosphate synthase/phosphatase
VLVLSEFAGAAAEMGEALLVNPYDEEQVATTLLRALAMPERERKDRMYALHSRVRRKTVYTWAEGFVRDLRSAAAAREDSAARAIDAAQLREAYAAANRRVLLLDYDGTLTGFAARPEDAAPSGLALDTLNALCSDGANRVALVSGRRAADLEQWFGAMEGLTLAAEHGAKVRENGAWRTLQDGAPPSEWKEKVRPILQHYVERTPGSLIEEKEFSIAWHYRRVEEGFGEWLAGDLVELLEDLLANTEARPVRGQKVIEVRPLWANKGEFAAWFTDQSPEADFWFAAGDDRTDEDLFAQAPERGWTVHVGSGPTRAAWEVRDPAALLDVLAQMVRRSRRAG